MTDNEIVVSRAVFNTDAASRLTLFLAKRLGTREYRTFSQWYCRVHWYKSRPYCIERVRLT